MYCYTHYIDFVNGLTKKNMFNHLRRVWDGREQPFNKDEQRQMWLNWNIFRLFKKKIYIFHGFYQHVQCMQQQQQQQHVDRLCGAARDKSERFPPEPSRLPWFPAQRHIRALLQSSGRDKLVTIYGNYWKENSEVKPKISQSTCAFATGDPTQCRSVRQRWEIDP